MGITKNIAMSLFLGAFAFGNMAVAQSVAFQQGLIKAAESDKDVAAYYKAHNYAPLWTTENGIHKKRIDALITAFAQSGSHGLPRDAYDVGALKSRIAKAQTDADFGALEAQLSRLFLQYARDVQTGITVPSRIDSEIVRKVPYRGRQGTLVAFSKSSPTGFMKALPPKTPEYARLMREKLALERLIGAGGWGPTVPGKKLEMGASGDAVVALRNRLQAMGFMGRSTTAVYDDAIKTAVQQFQLAHGLATDGVAGAGTLKEINRDVTYRLKSVIVAMERERWMNRPRGERHIWVNLTDFHAKIIDGNKVTFETRSVVGAHDKDRRSPEFSDVMEFMVINPSWYVPRSIAVK
ncbi:MAG: peptidoglycan-binding protein, partial [Pseudomonadota bacterium]